MSTSVQQDVYEPMFFSSSLSSQILDTYNVVGEEMQLKEAAKAYDKFDKFVILVAHGETASTNENESSLSSPNDISLSGKGFGQALSVSGETARYCSSKSLTPQLFIVAPQRCAIESALIAFPTFGPESIYGQRWVSDTRCTDAFATNSDTQRLQEAFPSISFEHASSDKNDFIHYITSLEEKIIVISSTPSWIQSFLSEFNHSKRDLNSSQVRVLGINLI
jgi:hypothetical protein